MRRRNSFRASMVALMVLAATLPAFSRGINAAVVHPNDPPPTSNIVIGFVGGFVSHDNPHHGPVQLAQRIRQTVPKGTYVRVFENRHRGRAYDVILNLLDTDRDGILSPEEKAQARIVLFGHSWGASAAVLLARDLGREGVPVLLTVQVDSVVKPFQNDSVIPDNVVEAINFFQTQGIIHGRRQITAADPSRTQILGNYLMDYKTNPIGCPQASWWERFLTPGHMQSECDPNLWSQIETMVTQRISPNTTSVAIAPANPPHLSR